MSKFKIKEQHIEGAIIILIGLFIFISALQIKDNPFKLAEGAPGIIKIFTEARIVPVVLSIAIMAFGAIVALSKKNAPQYLLGGEILNIFRANSRSIVTILITFVYVLLIGNINFVAATFIYLLAVIMYLKFKEIHSVRQLMKNVLIALIGTFFTAYLIPLSLNMMLP